MTPSPLDHLRPLSAEDLPAVRLRRQWCLARGRAGPEDWPECRLGSGWSVVHHADLAVRVLGDGLALLGEASLVGATSEADFLTELGGAAQSHEALLTALERLAGVYVLVHVAGGEANVYTDPGGMMGVVFEPGIAASSPALLPRISRDESLDAVYTFGGTDDWYPGSLTPFRGVRALLANHVLDVDTGAMTRFWPTEAPRGRSQDDALDRAAALLRGHMQSLVYRRPCLVSLTGGRDSRLSLATLRDCHDQVAFFTIATPGVKACDQEIPAELAERFELRHLFVDDAECGPWLTGAYDEITGGQAIGARREILGACAQLAGAEIVHVSGNLGAILKSFFWHSKDPREVRVDSLMKEFTQKPGLIRNGVEEWLRSVPGHFPAPFIYDLMYLEQRGGRWMGPGEAAASLFYAPYTPFCSRELFMVLESMPPAALFGGTSLEELSRRLWPEVGEHRYCPITRSWGRFLPRGLKNRIRSLLKA
ncbi:MAG: hypothetical protein O2816_16700 [Planctomycetota bacterium]|nr:hypothetical protein [Planctomycetota bacterium]